jgi:chromosomal replication initiator protein
MRFDKRYAPTREARRAYREAEGRVAAAQIVEEVAEKHGMTPTQMLKAQGNPPIWDAKAEAFWRMYHQTHLSYPGIGRLYGRDHTTVQNAVRRHQKALDAASQSA